MTTPPPPPAQPPAAGPDPETSARLGAIERTLAALVPTSHAQAQAHTEQRLSRPDEVEQQVAAALRQARIDAKNDAEAQEAKAHREDMTKRVAALETAPRAAVRGIEKFMGWGD
jgi:hypothetical protein